jgi:hypothetical protein
MTTALRFDTFEEMVAANAIEHMRRLAFIRSRLTPTGGLFEGGNDLCYIIHPNTHTDRDKYPWQVTTLQHDRADPSLLIPCSHTTHRHLDLEEDHGCYYASAVWEIAWSIKL